MRRTLRLLGLALAVVAAIALILVAVPGPRSGAVSLALRIALAQRGYHLTGGAFAVGAHEIDIDGLSIADNTGAPLFSAKHIVIYYDAAGLFGRSDRAYGIHAVVVTSPIVSIVRHADGSFNIWQPQLGPPSPAAAGAPLRCTISVRDGRLTFVNPEAFAVPGRQFAVAGIRLTADIAQGAQSRAALDGDFEPAGVGDPSKVSHVRASLTENDDQRYAVATVAARRLDVAPIVDGLVSTPNFVIEAGVADVSLAMFDAGYDRSAGPQWQVSGVAPLHGGRVRFLPLVVPLRDVDGTLRFSGGELSVAGLRGTAGGVPVALDGGIRLVGGVRLAMGASVAADLRRLRRLFAFSASQPLTGDIAMHVHVDGPPDALHVRGAFRAPGVATFQEIALDGIAGDMYYADGHVTLTHVAAGYSGGRVFGGGDIDVWSIDRASAFALEARAPASTIPVVANINPYGEVAALASFSGPLAALSGDGYAQVTGGDGVELRTTVVAGPRRLSIGPLIARGMGGELALALGVDRPEHGPRTISGDLIADATTIHLSSGSHELAGTGAPIDLPSVAGTFDGAAWVSGDERTPVIGADLRARGLVIAGERLGAGRLIASGVGTAIRIGELSVAGPDATVTARGFAAARPNAGRYAAALEGSGTLALAALPGFPPGADARGHASGNFSALLSDGRWTASGDATSADATLYGVPVRALRATLSGGGGRPTQVYAATASAAGGALAATGTVPRAATADGGELSVWARGVDVRELRSLGMPLRSGTAIAFASIGGSLSSPTGAGVASLSDGRYGSIPVSGDMDVAFAGGRLSTQAGRVALAGNRVGVVGTVAGVGPAAPLRDAALDVRATMRVGDLGGLLDPYMPPSVGVAGLVAGVLRVSGSVGAPALDGIIDSPGGSVRGVAFNSLHGALHAAPGALTLSDGEVQLGSSQFTLAGSLTPRGVRMRSTSPHVDLSDFNDFFNGYDTFDGVGTWRVAFSSSPAGIAANGALNVNDAAIVGYPLGSVDATFSGKGDALLATLRQRGPADDATLSGSVAFPRRTGAVPDVASAWFDVRGAATGVDLGVVMPLIRHEDLGLTGRLDVEGSFRGHLNHPSSFATFALRDGHVGKLPVTALSGSLESDGASYGVNDFRLELPFAKAAGSAQFGPGKRLVGSVGIDAQDLSKVASAFGRPGIVEGAGRATVSIAGTLQRPRVQASFQGGKGAALGVGFDSASAKVNYQPGEVDITDATIVLAGARGVVSLTGTLPLQLAPLSLGPKDKPIDLRLSARDVELSAFDALTSRFVTLTGRLQATASAVGKAGNPVLGGSATLRGASVRSPFENVPIEGLQADLTLAQDTVTLSHFHGTLGKGDIAARASAHVVPAVGLRTNAGLQYSARIAFNSARIDVPGWLNGVFDGNFNLTKSGKNPFLAGTMSASDATIPFSAIYLLASGFGQNGSPPQAPGPVPGVPAPLPGRTVAYAGSIYGGGFHLVSSGPAAQATPSGFVLPAVDLDVTATAGKRVRVKGGALDLTAGGTIKVGGNLHEPTLAGQFSSTRGQVTYFDTVFRIERGVVIFSPSEGLLPTLDVRATTNAGGSQITLAISGRVDRLSTDMSSVPSMTRDQIAATLLHAPQVTSLTNSTPAQAQAILTGEAQAYFNAQLTRSLLFPLESFLAESLNIEQINFIFDEHGKPAIEVRKLFTPTIYGIYRSTVNLPVTQSFGVAYILRDTTSLELLQTQTPTGVSDATLALRFSFH